LGTKLALPLFRKSATTPAKLTLSLEEAMHMETLQDLFVDQLRDLYNAENQLVKALPKMAKSADSEELKTAFEEHLEETKGHVERIEQIFERIGAKPGGKTCKAMKGLVEEGSEMMREDAEPPVMDAGLIAAAQRVEHYEMAGYGCVVNYAKLLGDEEAADLLQETLQEEMAADKKLTRLAESGINKRAMQPN
jgi:ferritin-like metal-binding protein YciE